MKTNYKTLFELSSENPIVIIIQCKVVAVQRQTVNLQRKEQVDIAAKDQDNERIANLQ